MRAAPIFNAPVVALTTSPRWGRFVGRTFAMITYTGRKSGRVIACRSDIVAAATTS
jgi:hypothetical protein